MCIIQQHLIHHMEQNHHPYQVPNVYCYLQLGQSLKKKGQPLVHFPVRFPNKIMMGYRIWKSEGFH